MRRVLAFLSSATYSLHAQRLVPGAVLGNPHYQGAIYIGKGHALKISKLEEQALIVRSSPSEEENEITSNIERAW